MWVEHEYHNNEESRGGSVSILVFWLQHKQTQLKQDEEEEEEEEETGNESEKSRQVDLDRFFYFILFLRRFSFQSGDAVLFSVIRVKQIRKSESWDGMRVLVSLLTYFFEEDLEER